MNPQDRGPLIIAGGIVIAGLFIAIAIYLSRGPADVATAPAPTHSPRPAISVSPTAAPEPNTAEQDRETKDNLEEAIGAATKIYEDGGDFSAADSFSMAQAFPRFTYQESIRDSTDPQDISVYATDTEWSAAAASGSESCFWIKVAVEAAGDEPQVSYGAGSPCTGRAASSATAGNWPA
ncbi:MAG: hypothetical protein WD004_02565 [Actinomycetota bacterium]